MAPDINVGLRITQLHIRLQASWTSRVRAILEPQPCAQCTRMIYGRRGHLPIEQSKREKQRGNDANPTAQLAGAESARMASFLLCLQRCLGSLWLTICAHHRGKLATQKGAPTEMGWCGQFLEKARFPLSRGGRAGFGEGEKSGKGTEKEVTVRTSECPQHAGASESVWTVADASAGSEEVSLSSGKGQPRENHGWQADASQSCAAHGPQSLVMLAPVCRPGKETALLGTHRAQTSQEERTWQSEPGCSLNTPQIALSSLHRGARICNAPETA